MLQQSQYLVLQANHAAIKNKRKIFASKKLCFLETILWDGKYHF